MTRTGRSVLFLSVLGLASGALRANPGQEALRERASSLNVLLVTIDTLRADRVGAYGYARAKTPVLDSLAENGARFERAYSHHPVTLPSHATLLTGTHAVYHGVEDNGLYRLPQASETLAETLRASGFATGAVISAFVLNSQYGLDQGFDRYDDSLDEGRKQNSAGYDEVTASVVSDRGLAFVSEHADERWFLWLHYYDPHGEFEPPDAFRTAGADLYDGEIAYVDHELGRVLSDLRSRELEERTLVVVTSDHGESLGEHGELAHGLFLYDATMRVPLILSLPGTIPSGRVVRPIVSLVDVAPTILEAVGTDPLAEQHGRSLMPLVLEDAPDWSEASVWMEAMTPWNHYGWSPSRALVRGRHKLIRAPKPELYDLANDPAENENVIDDNRALARELSGELESLERRYAPSSRSPTESRVELDEESRARLESLGYVFSGASSREPAVDAPDVKDRIRLTHAIKNASDLRDAGRAREAYDVLEQVLEESPESRLVRNRLGAWYALDGDLANGEKYLKGLIELDPGYLDGYENLGLLYANAGRLTEAETMAGIVLEKMPRSAKGHGLLGIIRLKQKDYRGALEALDGAIAAFPGDHEALANRSVAHYFLGNLDQALADLKTAARIVPDNPRYRQFVAQLEQQMRSR